MKFKIGITLFIVFLIGIFLLHISVSTKEARKYTIKRGDFIATINETGELEAVNSRIVTVPFIGWKYGSQLKIIGLVEHGSHVSEGDSIAQFSKDTVLKYILEQQNRQETENANLNILLAQQKSRIKALETEIASTEAELNLKKLQLEKYKFESPKNQKIKQLDYERQLIKFNKVEKKYNLSKIVFENELKIQQIKIFQIQNGIKDANSALNHLTIRSPLNGMMQLTKSSWSRTEQIVRIGDALYQSETFAGVPDLSRMKVKSSVNETDIGKIHLNQRVIVRLDAFPSISFEGKIIDIGKLSYKKDEKSLMKVFDIVVILNNSDPILKPDMTVRCEIFTAQLKDVFYVENDCLYKENMKYYIFLVQKDNFEKTEIKLGPSNNEFTVINGNFENGQSIVPLSQVKLKTDI
jgi:HlyD family secretion protein